MNRGGGAFTGGITGRITGRQWLLIATVLVVLGLMISIAPATNTQQRGSTYGRSPADYGAWYAEMAAQGADIHRWRQPIAALLEQVAASDRTNAEAVASQPSPHTLIQIYPELQPLWATSELIDWLEAGHHLVILGLRTPATAAPFRATVTTVDPSLTNIQVETRRRANRLLAIHHETPIAQDQYGAIAWEEVIDERPGHLTLINTPTLAANAYQAYPDNFAFLSAIAQQAGGTIWVDEYLHGYQDSTTTPADQSDAAPRSWLAYLAATPLRLVLIQVGLVTLVAIAALNWRFGRAMAWTAPRRNNSAEYIQALAQVLRKADSLTFVRDTIGREERRQLQHALGLGHTPVDDATLKQTWAQHTGRSDTDLRPYFLPPDRRRLNEAILLEWLTTLQTLRQGVK